jgi:predicted GTPase
VVLTFFEGENCKQELAIDEADVIIFVVDVEEGITPWMMLSQDYCVKSLNPFCK